MFRLLRNTIITKSKSEQMVPILPRWKTSQTSYKTELDLRRAKVRSWVCGSVTSQGLPIFVSRGDLLCTRSLSSSNPSHRIQSPSRIQRGTTPSQLTEIGDYICKCPLAKQVHIQRFWMDMNLGGGALFHLLYHKKGKSEVFLHMPGARAI